VISHKITPKKKLKNDQKKDTLTTKFKPKRGAKDQGRITKVEVGRWSMATTGGSPWEPKSKRSKELHKNWGGMLYEALNWK